MPGVFVVPSVNPAGLRVPGMRSVPTVVHLTVRWPGTRSTRDSTGSFSQLWVLGISRLGRGLSGVVMRVTMILHVTHSSGHSLA